MNNSQSTANMKLERAIRPIFTSLPMPRGVDADWLLAGYHVALDGLPIDAIEAVAVKLVKGTWYSEVTFCPRPPELANMVRKEASMMAERRKPHVPMIAADRPYISPADRDRERRIQLQRKGFTFLCEGGLEKFNNMSKKRELPAGSTCLWAIDEIWAAPVTERVKRAAA